MSGKKDDKAKRKTTKLNPPKNISEYENFITTA
jgi:hypothetical protein